MAEPVRLVIWDLDDTFWQGTLSEGGIQAPTANVGIVTELARRGIVSTICSKNDYAAVETELKAIGVWQYFVLPSINWEPKGPRIAALIEDFQLRPATVMFIDDNETNLNEVKFFVPGIQLASHEFIPKMLESPLLRGKDDAGLTRLQQYKALETRKADAKRAGGDTRNFLRASNIRVRFDYDLAAHADRAIELINRTNQLNFTKSRLPEDPAQARDALADLLRRHDIQAGLLRVTDRYGDHGFAGLYVLRSGFELLHFCFSCRILGMGVEQWLYNKLHRPKLDIVGEVLSNPTTDSPDVDWISVQDTAEPSAVAQARGIPRIVARGGCDLQAVTHYLEFAAEEVITEVNAGRTGFDARIDHSCFLRQALDGVSVDALCVARALGYADQDFRSALFEPTSTRSIWLLSFWSDSSYALYRHRATGLIVPFPAPGQSNHLLDVRALDGEIPIAVATGIARLKSEFDFIGPASEAYFKETLHSVLRRRRASTMVMLLGANETLVDHEHGVRHESIFNRNLNRWMHDVAKHYADVTVLDIRAFIGSDREVHDWNHFDRMVYYRIAQHVIAQA